METNVSEKIHQPFCSQLHLLPPTVNPFAPTLSTMSGNELDAVSQRLLDEVFENKQENFEMKQTIADILSKAPRLRESVQNILKNTKKTATKAKKTPKFE